MARKVAFAGRDVALMGAHLKRTFPSPALQLSTIHFSANREPWIVSVMMRLRRGASLQRLSAFFQPIASLHSGEILGHEVLARQPGAAGAPRRISYSGDRMLQLQAARLLSANDSHGLVFLNTSREWLSSARQARRAAENLRIVCAAKEILPGRVVVEISERLSPQKNALILEFARDLRAMGFLIALDDFGAANSDLDRLAMVEPDFAKVDRNMLKTATHSPAHHRILKSFCRMAADGGARVIVEGIEDERDLYAATDAGAAFGQGYHLAVPASRPLARQGRERLKVQLLRSGAQFGYFQSDARSRYDHLRRTAFAALDRLAHSLDKLTIENIVATGPWTDLPSDLLDRLRQVRLIDSRGFGLWTHVPEMSSSHMRLGRGGLETGVQLSRPWLDAASRELRVSAWLPLRMGLRICLDFSVDEEYSVLWFRDLAATEAS